MDDPGMAAPVLSAAMPRMLPKVDCADAVAERNVAKRRKATERERAACFIGGLVGVCQWKTDAHNHYSEKFIKKVSESA
jgi:hypothetical protein